MEKEILEDIYRGLKMNVSSKLVWTQDYKPNSSLIAWREKRVSGSMLFQRDQSLHLGS